jgi:hypothetical protein
VYVYFRAQKDDSSRSEQYFAKYVSQGGDLSFSEVKREIESRVRDGWGHRITTDGKGMGVFNSMGSRNVTTPGSETDRTVLTQLLRSRSATVGVPDEEAAIGLLDAMIREYRSAAIQKSGASTANTDFEMYVRHGDARRGEISYLGEKSEWENARDQVRDEVVNQKVDRIQSEVRELSSEWGVSDREIRQSVTSRVPALRQPNRSTGGSLGGGNSPLGGSNDTVFGVDKQLLTLGTAGVLLLAVVAAGAIAFAPGLFGLDGESSGERFAVQSINVSSNGEGYAAGQNVTVTLDLNTGVPEDPESPYNVSIRATATNGDWSDAGNVSARESGNSLDHVVWDGVRLPTEPTEVTISINVEESSIDLVENESTLTRTITVGTAPPSEVVFDPSDNISVVAGENRTVTATLRDEYGNTVRENGTTVDVTVESDSIQLRENGTVNQTKLSVADGAATFELTSDRPNTTGNVTVNVRDNELSEVLRVRTQQPNVSLSESLVTVGREGKKVSLDKDDEPSVTVESGETIGVGFTLRNDGGIVVTNASITSDVLVADPNVTSEENTSLESVPGREEATASFNFTAMPPSNRTYTLKFSFDRTPSDGDRTDGLERQNVTVTVTTPTNTTEGNSTSGTENDTNATQAKAVTVTTTVWSGHSDGSVSEQTESHPVLPTAGRTVFKETAKSDG